MFRSAGPAVLVEAHDEAELDRALALGTPLLGVNNRDLRTFTVDLATTERLAAHLRAHPAGSQIVLVAESGIHTRADVERLHRAGAQAVLAGESLMRHPGLAAKIHELIGGRPAGSGASQPEPLSGPGDKTPTDVGLRLVQSGFPSQAVRVPCA